MNYIKISLPHGEGGMKYPSGYSSLEPFITDHLYAEEESAEGIKSTDLLLEIRDGVDWKTILGDKDRVSDMSEIEAIAFSNDNEELSEQITDEAKIKRLTIKSQLGLEFTTDELDAIDPSKDVKGVSYNKRFSDRISEAKVKRQAKQA